MPDGKYGNVLNRKYSKILDRKKKLNDKYCFIMEKNDFENVDFQKNRKF